jgi:hypothetical protein
VLVGHVTYQKTAILYKETDHSALLHFACFYKIYNRLYYDGPQLLVNYKTSRGMRNLSVFWGGAKLYKECPDISVGVFSNI